MTYPAQNPPPTPAPVQMSAQRNTIGLIALICAIAGFILACIPGALIAGWILLPISFILGLVSLFQKGHTRWQGITAIVLSIVGTAVAVLVFLVVASNALDDALGTSSDTVVSSTTDSASTDGAGSNSNGKAPTGTDTGTRENPAALGSEISSDEWKVVVNSVTFDATAEVIAENPFNDSPADGDEYILINYTVTYVGDDPDGGMPAFVTVNYVTADGVTIDGSDTLAVAPDEIDTLTTLYNGGSVTGNEAIAVPSASAQDGVLAVQPGLLANKAFVAVK
ncbi:hypothetical protein [Actinomyces sp.]|uniref:hypothetical protein n=1 Tax=Actinomyces sp. TaxID=29317 RepID=UPI0026DC05CF|nr:hypothetical protein [Actinomyces sp.]MDO4899191.1 hypothetical protein [Actinomyces sp.]